MAQPGASDYLSQQPTAPEQAREVMRQLGDKAQGIGNSATSMASELASAIKERPYVTLAIATGLAFAIGAVWQLKARRPQTRLEGLLAQLAELTPSGLGVHNRLPRAWR
jgi:ElaB/YqjD/DUF883 family membrane-anchored ribosome-binding protein